MKIKKLLFLSFLLAFINLGCKKDEEEAIIKPSNLVIEATVGEDGSGLVNFSSTADNAAYYNYYFGISSTETPTKSTDGKASFTYTVSGDYTIKVEAVSSNKQTISATKTITVQVDELAPSNLVVNANVSNNGSGVVTFSASADNSTYYNFYFGTSDTESPTKSTTGDVTYTYTEPGTFTVKVEAYNETKFISATKEITVEVREDIGYLSPDNYTGMDLVWRDEFNGISLNEADWSYETGGGGWGNNELEYYRPENTTVADGFLTITAKKEAFGGRQYTSSRLVTKDKQSFKYGRIDIRAKLPQGQGIWPALWMLGSNFSTIGWPKCGEIDIMEMVGGTGKDNVVHGTAHWFGSAYASYTGHTSLTSGIFADEFHVFSITWDENFITWYLDDKQFHIIDIRPADLSEFRENFFLIFNVAVGGNWPGSPNSSTVFPQSMKVDYVRVFQTKP